jgi:hypothetical protein
LGISKQIPDPPGEDAVMLPFHPNPKMRPQTGLARRSGVIVDWAVPIDQGDVNNRNVGSVSAALLADILTKWAERKSARGAAG